MCPGSCWTQKTTSILGRSGTATAPPCWPPSRSTATPPSTWASWETSTPSCSYYNCYYSVHQSPIRRPQLVLYLVVSISVCVCVFLQPRWPSQRSEWRHQPCWCHHHLRRSVHGREGVMALQIFYHDAVFYWHLVVRGGNNSLYFKL